jgi:hypothetical protein
MNILLIILIVAALVIAALLIAALFTQKEYTVVRETNIIKPKQSVFEYIKFLKNQDSFSKWANMDPNMKKEYKGIDGTVGFVSAWDSNDKKVGKGEQEIVKITEGERIDYELRFIKPFAGKAKAHMLTKKIGENETRVIWGIESGMKYPMNLMLLFMNMDKIMGNDLEVGLANLKKALEKKI